MRLVAWNRRYQQLFGYPDGMLYVGRPVADLIRCNAERGEMGERRHRRHRSQRRIEHMRAGSPHVFERVRANGQVIEMRGQPLPGGGYVTSYSDITDYKRAEQRAARDQRNAGAARRAAHPRSRVRAAVARRASSPRSATTCCSR